MSRQPGLANLGVTRGSHHHNHFLQTPDTFVRAPLPGMTGCTAVVHVGPAAGASFSEYTAEMDAGGYLGPTDAQRFVYVLEGSLSVGEQTVAERGYAYVPASADARITAKVSSRLAVIEKAYRPLAGVNAPGPMVSSEDVVTAQPLMGDEDLQVRTLLPPGEVFDFAVNTMTFQPGASLAMTEMHVMEHGLLMLDGSGIYRLGDHWYPVSAGDFIWMGPFCPQWFGAIGKVPARYLIYKDWNRHPLA